jgi:hypothetical protein
MHNPQSYQKDQGYDSFIFEDRASLQTTTMMMMMMMMTTTTTTNGQVK